MSRAIQFSLILFFLVASMQRVIGHVELDYPEGGETFTAGEVVKVKWHVVIEHDPVDWDLYFSSDGGATWEIISSLPVERLEYDWTVPENYTESGRIKIVQDNDTQDDYDDICGDFTIEATVTPVLVTEDLDYKLFPNYPNPFQWSTTIQYEAPEKTDVILTLYTLQGKKVATLLDTETPPGRHVYYFQRSGLPEGFYLYQIQMGEYSESRKMLILN